MPGKQPLSRQAVAIRMTCCDPDVTGCAGAPVIVSADTSARALALAGQKESLEVRAGDFGLGTVLHWSGKDTPEALRDALAATIRETHTVPAVVALDGEALFAVGRNGAETRAMISVLLGAKGQESGVRAGPEGRRLAGVAAVVTGGAQGFGRGIAEELLNEGAAVVLADVNAAGGEGAAAEMNSRFGEGSVLFQKTDVTDLASIEGCVDAAACAFGGVDLFISNAGVLKAGSLEEMDEKSFDLVTRVNYKAYFLGAKAVAPLMKLQHRYNPSHFMDIVQINSKSGLEGSNRNFAYAGGKFGGIGLTQSFALELAPHHIKVNAICPGNYFDGPLWSDPEKGLFVQYLKAGKVPGAKTVEDVRASYVSKVPMGRGCLPRDVAHAILYLREQEYETGQALPVTGGQVMLR